MKAPNYDIHVNEETVRRGGSPRYLTLFDSCATLLRALASSLHGHELEGLGVPMFLRPLAYFFDMLPEKGRELIYRIGGSGEGVPPEYAGNIRAETVKSWMVHQYPRRKYPAIMIGSSNGAAMHLAAALGIPWLPQTFLVLIKHHRISPDDPLEAIEVAEKPAKAVLAANPELQLNHMRDPNQDRLMCQDVLYFRMKHLALGQAYQDFIKDCLEPDGTIILVDCQMSWPVVRMGERHFFQHGGAGVLPAIEYYEPSPRVADFLKRMGSHRRFWNPPAPTEVRPEAEWGFEPALEEDVTNFAEREGYRVRTLRFDDPESISPLVADLYRWWYAKYGVHSAKLFIECFFMVAPWWTLTTRHIPLWLVFNSEASAETLERYLNKTGAFDEQVMTLFSNEVRAIGQAPITRWKEQLMRAKVRGRFAGAHEANYPKDFSTYIRYSSALNGHVDRRPPPPALSLPEFERFLVEHVTDYPVHYAPLAEKV